MSKYLTTPDECARVLAGADCIIFDMDGVLWHYAGKVILPGVIKSLNALEQSGKKLLFATNRTTFTPDGFVKLLGGYGYKASPDQIYSSPVVTAWQLKKTLPDDKRAVISIGYVAVDEALNDCGIKTYSGIEAANNPDPDSLSKSPPFEGRFASRIGAVVVSDGRVSASRRILSEDYSKTLAFLKAHPDIPMIIGSFDSIVDNGKDIRDGVSDVHTLFLNAGRKFPMTFGKPFLPMMDMIKEKGGIDPSRTIMVGDNLHGDIRFGSDGGVQTLFITTGAFYNPSDLEVILPTYIVRSVPEFVGLGLGNQDILDDLPALNVIVDKRT